MLDVLIMFTEINSFAYLSIFSLVLSLLNYDIFNIGIVILVTKTLNLGGDLFKKNLMQAYRYEDQIMTPKKGRSTILDTDIFYNTRFFILTLTKAYFEARKQIFPFVNNVENRVGSKNVVYQSHLVSFDAGNCTSKNPEL